MPMNHYIGKNVWILKPNSMNRGKGIHVTASMKKLKKLIRDYCRGKEQVSAIYSPAKANDILHLKDETIDK
jgi:phosphoribosylamine-glycine ligase